MDIISALAAGVSLASDAMAVSVCCGLKSRGGYKKTAVYTAMTFGIFQMIMLLLGWSIGKVGCSLISGAEQIISFVILMLLGIKMLADARQDQNSVIKTLTVREVLLLAVATSIDALALGMVLPAAVGVRSVWNIIITVLLTGAITFIMSYAGFFLGRKAKFFRPAYAELFGGAVLILLGIKLLVQFIIR